ncbi:MAG: hypothetical protein NVSMB58_33540 [Terriglobales bacterium]
MLSAGFALPALLGLEIVVLFVLAGWAGGAIGPSHFGNGINADLLIGEMPDGIL